MKILMDVDNVIANTAEYTLQVLGNLGYKHDDVVDHNRLFTWNFWNGMSASMQRVFFSLWEDPAFWAGIPISKFGNDFQYWHSGGPDIDIVFVTTPWAQCAHWREVRERWLDTQFGHISTEIIFTDDKSKVEGDFLLDDSVSNVQKYKGRSVLFSTRFNSEAKGLHRIYGTEGFRSIIEQIEKEKA